MLDGLEEFGYWGLLLASFLAATILPLSSEVVFAALIAAKSDIPSCIFFATLGNALGGATCYYLGHFGKTAWLEKWFKIKREKIDSIIQKLKGKGAVMGFFGFLPVIGDPILVALGFMRTNVFLTMLFMTTGKLLRYVVIAYGTDRIASWLF